MIKIEKAEVWGWEHAIRGMRNPLNSWDRSDSTASQLGEKDRQLMMKLIKAGQPHRKFLRQIFVSVDITAPLYWWKEFDTYKVGTTANSCSTMHKIAAKEFTLDDFSREQLITLESIPTRTYSPYQMMCATIDNLNIIRELYLETKNKKWWWQLIQLLPSSYNQKRTVTMTYENLLNMLEYRRGHKLDEWLYFCDWITSLPNADLLKEGLE